MKVGLFGTVVRDKSLDNIHGWRKDLIPMLKCDYYNPVVYNRDKKAYEEEYKQKEECDILVFCLSVNLMGYFSIAECVDSVYRKGGENTVFCILNKEYFPYGKLRSLLDVEDLLRRRGCYIADDLNDIANYINKRCE